MYLLFIFLLLLSNIINIVIKFNILYLSIDSILITYIKISYFVYNRRWIRRYKWIWNNKTKKFNIKYSWWYTWQTKIISYI